MNLQPTWLQLMIFPDFIFLSLYQYLAANQP